MGVRRCIVSTDRTKRAFRLNLEALDFRDVPSSVIDPSLGDPVLTSIPMPDSNGQSGLVSHQDTSSTSETQANHHKTNQTGDTGSPPTTSTSKNHLPTNTGSTKSGVVPTAGSMANPAVAIPSSAKAANKANSISSHTANPASTHTQNSSTGTGTAVGMAATNATQNGHSGTHASLMKVATGSGNNTCEIVNFAAIETGLGMWEFTGTVVDANPGGLTVSFGGQPVSLQGETATTDANGNFGLGIILNTDGSDDGIATSQTVDGQGIPSNVAKCVVNAS